MVIDSNLIKEKTKKEIENKISLMGDYLRMNYLQRALKSKLDFDTEKYVLEKLSQIYESKNMFLEAARLIRTSAEINSTFKKKIKDYMKSVELFISGEDYGEADNVFLKAFEIGNSREKVILKESLKKIYFAQAEFIIEKDRRMAAKKIYEKIYSLDLDLFEKDFVKEKLLLLYDRLGDIKEYYNLQKED